MFQAPDSFVMKLIGGAALRSRTGNAADSRWQSNYGCCNPFLIHPHSPQETNHLAGRSPAYFAMAARDVLDHTTRDCYALSVSDFIDLGYEGSCRGPEAVTSDVSDEGWALVSP